MTDENLESAQTGTNGGTPIPQVTPASGQPTSVSDADLRAGFEALQREVKGLTKALSTFQSGKDRGLNEVKGRLGDIEALMKEKNVGVGEALTILEGREAEEGLRNDMRVLADHLRKNGSLPALGKQTDPQVAQVIAKLGLNESDPEVVALIGAHEKDLVSLSVEGAKLALARANRPTPSPELAVSPQPGQGVVKLRNEDVEAKSARLIELYRAPSKNRDAIKQLEKELEPYLPG